SLTDQFPHEPQLRTTRYRRHVHDVPQRTVTQPQLRPLPLRLHLRHEAELRQDPPRLLHARASFQPLHTRQRRTPPLADVRLEELLQQRFVARPLQVYHQLAQQLALSPREQRLRLTRETIFHFRPPRPRAPRAAPLHQPAAAQHPQMVPHGLHVQSRVLCQLRYRRRPAPLQRPEQHRPAATAPFHQFHDSEHRRSAGICQEKYLDNLSGFSLPRDRGFSPPKILWRLTERAGGKSYLRVRNTTHHNPDRG